jgi:hypothetical protein
MLTLIETEETFRENFNELLSLLGLEPLPKNPVDTITETLSKSQ